MVVSLFVMTRSRWPRRLSLACLHGSEEGGCWCRFQGFWKYKANTVPDFRLCRRACRVTELSRTFAVCRVAGCVSDRWSPARVPGLGDDLMTVSGASSGRSEQFGEMTKPAVRRALRGFGRSDWIRTSDLLVPNETRYQAALRSVWMARILQKNF